MYNCHILMVLMRTYKVLFYVLSPFKNGTFGYYDNEKLFFFARIRSFSLILKENSTY